MALTVTLNLTDDQQAAVQHVATLANAIDSSSPTDPRAYLTARVGDVLNDYVLRYHADNPNAAGLQQAIAAASPQQVAAIAAAVPPDILAQVSVLLGVAPSQPVNP